MAELRKLLNVLVLLLVAAPATPVLAGESESHTIAIGGMERSYLLYRPSSQLSQLPLVIVLHGGFGTGAQAEKSYGWDALAERKGFLVAYPNGIRRAWNAGGTCCGQPARRGIDDIGFIAAVIREISRHEAIDQRRIYLTGISNGAALAYRYACEGGYAVAAIGAVSGSLAYPCHDPHAVSVMEIHGLEDQNIPMAGGIGRKGVSGVDWLGVEQTLDEFRRAADCRSPASAKAGPVTTTTSHCTRGRDVVLITIAGAGHQWPGARPLGPLVSMILPLDPPSTALDATTTLWQFFESHPR